MAAAPHLLRVDLAALEAVQGDGIGLFCWQDVRPLRGVAAFIDWRMCGRISQALSAGTFVGAAEEAALLPIKGRLGPRRLFLFGLGPSAPQPPAALGTLLERAHAVMAAAGVERIVLGSPHRPGDEGLPGAFLRAVEAGAAGQVHQLLVEK